MSSLDFKEAGHKLLKLKLDAGQEKEICIMLLECCSQETTSLRYYSLLGQRLCMINKVSLPGEFRKMLCPTILNDSLTGTDALPWHVLSYVRLTEDDTTSSSRIFIKLLFQELCNHLGIQLLNKRLNDPNMQDSFESIFPKDDPKNTRFSINLFTSIGLGGITDNLREHLKNVSRRVMQQQTDSESEDSKSRKRRRKS